MLRAIARFLFSLISQKRAVAGCCEIFGSEMFVENCVNGLKKIQELDPELSKNLQNSSWIILFAPKDMLNVSRSICSLSPKWQHWNVVGPMVVLIYGQSLKIHRIRDKSNISKRELIREICKQECVDWFARHNFSETQIEDIALTLKAI